MPRFGTMDVAAALGDAPEVDLDSPVWEMPDGLFLQINWEVDDAGALGLTPPACHPSIPPFASFFAARFTESPVGPFSIVQVRLVVRAGIRPRALCLGAVCDSADATDALRRYWGFPAVHGEVEVSQRHDLVSFSAALGGHEVATFAVRTADVINGNDLMTFDNLHLVRAAEGARLVQIDPEYTIHSADRGRPQVTLPVPEALGMQGRLRLASPIIGFTFRADTDLVPARFTIDPDVSALTSTKKIQRPQPA
jgi:hypothetical protein